MVQVLTGLDLSYIARYSRVLFCKSTWLKVGALLSTCRVDVKKDDKLHLNDADGFLALQRANWNMVLKTKESISTNAHISKNPDAFSPIAIIMVAIDMSTNHKSTDGWSDNFVDGCVRKGTIYGNIGIKTHVVVQFFLRTYPTKHLPKYQQIHYLCRMGRMMEPTAMKRSVLL